MDPQRQCCHNPTCVAAGRAGEGHIVIHSRREQRYRCKRCGRTFSARRGTALYRLRTATELVVTVVTLLAYGCPLQAIVVAFGLDERTVRRWQQRAGAQCQRVHEHVVQAGTVELGQVQADELRVRGVGGVYWLASARSVASRLWLGGAVAAQRDHRLIQRLLQGVRSCGATRRLVLCTDGFRSYVTQARRVFREPVSTGRRGRPRLVLPDSVHVAQVVKRYAKRRVVSISRHVRTGSAHAIQATVRATQGTATAVINTASAERLNATFRARLAPLARRTRAGVHQAATLTAGMWLVGTTYNFCWPQRSLRRRRALTDPPGRRWLERTPAQAAGLTDHRWSVRELLTFPVPVAARPRRGRRPRWLPARNAA